MSDRNSQYQSNPDKLNNSEKLLEQLWTKYSKKGPKFGTRDFEHIFNAIKNNDSLSEKEIDSLKILFRKELDLVREKSAKYARKILDHVGRANLTDSQVYEYVSEQCKKHKFSRPVCDAIYREVSHMLNDQPTRNSYFRYAPARNTKLASTLGFTSYENYDNVKLSGNDKTVVDDIMRLHQDNLVVHDSIIKQALQYTDCELTAITGQFIDNRHRAEVNVHPVLAAMFIPKIRILEENMLFSSITNVVRARVSNEPIQTRPDYELFYNISTDRNEFVCDNKNLWNDLKMRALIQVGLWRNVLALRSGRYYDDLTILPFLNELQTCNFYRYEAPDLIRSTDEPGSIIRRLLYTFSFKPVFVQTLPLGPSAVMSTNLMGTNAYVLPELYNGEMDYLPMVNMRINTPQNDQQVNLEDVLNNYEYYFDTSNGTFVPKMTKVVNAREILIIYVHRLNYSIDVASYGPFHFEKLPSIAGYNYRINTSVVRTREEMEVGDAVFELRSVVALKTTPLVDNNNRNVDLITGCETLIRPDNENNYFVDGEYLVYDPENVNKFLGDDGLKNNTPFTTARWDDSNMDRRVDVKIATKGVVYIYTKIEDTE